MKYSVLIILFFIFSQAYSQITITSDDLLDVGDSVTLAVVDTVSPGFTAGPAGANQHWDFSALEMDTTNQLNFVDPALTPYASSFPTSNIAVEGMVEGLADGTLDGGWAYTTKNSFVFQIDGVAGSYDIFEDVVAPFNPPEIMFSFPVNYLDSLTQTSTIDVTIESPEPPADSLRLKVVTSVETKVDAWGELTTPIWTGNVLRFRDVRTTIDSVWVKMLFFWVYLESSTNVSITYKYMANDVGYPVLQFSADTSETEFSAINYMLDAGVGLPDVLLGQQPELDVYPNPADHFVNIRYSISGIRNSILIYDVFGRLMNEIQTPQGQNQLRIDVSDYHPGLYQVILKNGKKILGQNKIIVK
ncbi:MAG: T9SS type A sorting domain-containing protein [Bacteroidota bacterium]